MNTISPNVNPLINLKDRKIIYRTIMGSHAYGTNGPSSDVDHYAVFLPTKEEMNPLLCGIYAGFNSKKFVDVIVEKGDIDINAYSLPRYMRLLMECNPNIIDSLFTDESEVLVACPELKNNRHMFLSKESFHRFRGYSKTQLDKLQNHSLESSRAHLVEAHGFDTKFAYHIVRIQNEAIQILRDGNLDLKKYSSTLRDIRDGKHTLREVQLIVEFGNIELEKWFKLSALPEKSDESRIHQLLKYMLEKYDCI